MNDQDEHLIERRVGGQTLLEGRLLVVRRDEVVLPDGSRSSREYIVHPGAVMIVPLLDDGRFVMERQFRYPVQQVLLEFPAGKLEAGESPLACARRELAEETGYVAGEWALAGQMVNAPAYADEVIRVMFARALRPGTRHPEAGEFLDVVLVEPRDLQERSAAGAVPDAKTVFGLHRWLLWQQGLWQPSWLRMDEGWDS